MLEAHIFKASGPVGLQLVRLSGWHNCPEDPEQDSVAGTQRCIMQTIYHLGKESIVTGTKESTLAVVAAKMGFWTRSQWTPPKLQNQNQALLHAGEKNA